MSFNITTAGSVSNGYLTVKVTVDNGPVALGDAFVKAQGGTAPGVHVHEQPAETLWSGDLKANQKKNVVVGKLRMGKDQDAVQWNIRLEGTAPDGQRICGRVGVNAVRGEDGFVFSDPSWVQMAPVGYYEPHLLAGAI